MSKPLNWQNQRPNKEEKEKPWLSRLTAILIQLRSKRMVTATQLAERHKVGVRAIYRDIRAL
ncbi:MAG: HTH domain-containing protein [Bacteroidota bacterium]